jgi:RimJ/RimL family protein N-acetyltransferase
MNATPLRIETERLMLEVLSFSDALFVKTLFNDPDCLRFIGDKGIVDIPSAERYLEQGPMASYQTHGFGLLKIITKETAQVIGCCGLLQRDYLTEPDIGFAGLPEFRGHGYLYEASLAILAQAKEKGIYQTIHALVDPENIASVNLLKKLGMTYQRKLIPPQDDRETDVYGILFTENS